MDYSQSDILDIESCIETCEAMDVIVHAAAVHEAGAVAKNPRAAVRINVEGTLNLLRAAVMSGARRFVYMSSAKIFGNPEALPSAEKDTLIPRETYALSKFVAEQYCREFHEQYGVEIVIVRPFSVYGPGQSLGTGYIGMIIDSILKGTQVRLPGRKYFVRDFVHIDDVTELCVQAIDADLPGITVLNAGSGAATTLGQLLKLASSVTEIELGGTFREPGAGTIERMLANMNHARRLLNFVPERDLHGGLEETIRWFSQNESFQKLAARQ